MTKKMDRPEEKAPSEELSQAAGSAAEPIRVSYSRKEIGDKAREWMRSEFGDVREKDEEDRDAYYLKLGVIYSFLCDHFPE